MDRGNYRNENFGRSRSRSRERQYSGNFRRNDTSSSSRSRSGLRASTNKDRVRCFKCREYDHFAKKFPNSQTEREPEQIQEMNNLDEDYTALKVLVAGTYDSHIRTNLDDPIEHLNV